METSFKEVFISFADDGIRLMVDMTLRDAGGFMLEGRIVKRTISDAEMRAPGSWAVARQQRPAVILPHVLETHHGPAVGPRSTLVEIVTRDRPLWTALLVVVGSLLIAASARVALPLPFSPVPVTAQTFAVLFIAAALGPRAATASVLLYLAEGAIGLPVFAPGGAPGFARFLGPTAGYLVGFVLAALVVGSLARIGWDRRFATALVAMVLGSAIIDATGLLWLSRFVPADRLFQAGLFPFIPGDLYKAVAAAAALPACWRFVKPRH